MCRLMRRSVSDMRGRVTLVIFRPVRGDIRDLVFMRVILSSAAMCLVRCVFCHAHLCQRVSFAIAKVIKKHTRIEERQFWREIPQRYMSFPKVSRRALTFAQHRLWCRHCVASADEVD